MAKPLLHTGIRKGRCPPKPKLRISPLPLSCSRAEMTPLQEHPVRLARYTGCGIIRLFIKTSSFDNENRVFAFPGNFFGNRTKEDLL